MAGQVRAPPPGSTMRPKLPIRIWKILNKSAGTWWSGQIYLLFVFRRVSKTETLIQTKLERNIFEMFRSDQMNSRKVQIQFVDYQRKGNDLQKFTF